MAALPQLAQTVREALAALKMEREKLQGKNIALTVGSRGIANLSLLVRTVGEVVESYRGATLHRSLHGEPWGRNT